MWLFSIPGYAWTSSDNRRGEICEGDQKFGVRSEAAPRRLPAEEVTDASINVHLTGKLLGACFQNVILVYNVVHCKCNIFVCNSWWRHQMETFSMLLAICAGNSPLSGEFPAQRPVTWSFDVFFDLHWINHWINNGEAGDLRCYRAHYDVLVMWVSIMNDDNAVGTDSLVVL